MPSPVTVRIKVPPYIKKYMLSQSINKQEPAIFPRKHVYSISIHQKVSNYNYLKYIPINERENIYEYFYHPKHQLHSYQYIEIQLPFNAVKDVRSFNFLGRDHKYKFVNEVKEDFYFELTRHIISRMRLNISRKNAIDEFIKNYNITEDDIRFESLYRQSSRILEPFL